MTKQHERSEATHRLFGIKMDTLEKSFRYLQSHVIGIGKPEDLSSELDGLIVGVESVEEMQREMESLGDAISPPGIRSRAGQRARA
jgi:hypothetical protein